MPITLLKPHIIKSFFTKSEEPTKYEVYEEVNIMMKHFHEIVLPYEALNKYCERAEEENQKVTDFRKFGLTF